MVDRDGERRAGPMSGGEMRIISFLTLPSTVEHILLHLDLP